MDQVQELIGKGRTREALQYLKEHAPAQLQEEVISLINRLSKLARDERMGVISYQDASVERNKIVSATLALGRQADEPPPSTPTPDKRSSEQSAGKAKIYFSYAWGAEGEAGKGGEKTVDALYDTLTKEDFSVYRDKMNVQYGGLISQFMKELGKGDLVVVFISEKYAKSPYCMHELHEIARNSNWEKQLFTSRVLPVPLERIRFDQPKVLDEYFGYWEEQEKEWAEFMARRLGQLSSENFKRYEYTRAINRDFGRLSDWLADINASSLTLLSENDFERVKQAIKERLAGAKA